MSTRITHAELSEDDWFAIRQASAAAAELLKAGEDAPDVVQAKIQQFVDDYADDAVGGAVENPLGENLSLALGALWGTSVCEAYGWNWIVPLQGDWRGLGVSDPEHAYLALPFSLFGRLVDGKDQEIPGSLLRYTAIGVNRLPKSSPGMYTILTN